MQHWESSARAIVPQTGSDAGNCWAGNCWVLRVCVGHVNCQFPFWPKDSLWAPGPGSFKVLRLLGAQGCDRLVLCWHNRGDLASRRWC